MIVVAGTLRERSPREVGRRTQQGLRRQRGGATMAAALDRFLSAGRIAVYVDLTRDIWLGAAASYRAYADRRLAAGVGWPRRILADSVVGAHAERRADLLLTYNSDYFERMLPDPEVVVPLTGTP